MRHSIQRFLPLLLIGVLLLALPLAAGASDHQHKYGEWTTTQPATCTDDGIRMRQCTCGDTQVESIPKLNHNWGPYLPTVPAKCDAEGTEVRTCIRDNAHTESRSIPKILHVMTPWVPEPPATCLVKGTEKRHCLNCATANEIRDIPALGHKWGGFLPHTPAKCESKGKQIRYCEHDLTHTDIVETPALGHNWTTFSPSKAATCTAKGEQVRYCQNDATHIDKVEIPALGHNWGNWTTTTNPTCSVAGEMARVCGRDATHKETKVIPKLGKNQPAGHKFGNWAETKAATCDAVGTEERSCSECGRVETRDIKKIPHTSNNTWVTSREPSLQQPGLQTTTCTVCNKQASSRTFAPRSIKYEMPSYAFGALANLANPAIAGQDKLIFIDMTQPGEKRFPLVTEDGYHIADVRVTVGAGTLSVKLEKLNNSTVLRYRTWHFFPSAEEVTRHKLESDSLPFEQPVAVSGDSCVIAVRTLSNYSQSHRENSAFNEAMMSLDGANSYADQAKQMLEQMSGGESP